MSELKNCFNINEYALIDPTATQRLQCAELSSKWLNKPQVLPAARVIEDWPSISFIRVRKFQQFIKVTNAFKC